ncbi:MAG: flavodoxin family protein [Synergistaceae bacterium]|jgi:multimeric flavodoxin WrbA|nr:flavodoxin family protein [Synergistaceae bacterium]
MKKVMAINGGPRKNWNTADMLRSALDGAASAGAETEMIHLYDLDYRGCVSCFSCKRVESYRDGKCAMRDGLSPVLDLVMESDAVVMGSPIYISDVTGALRSFWERLIFMNLAYDMEERSVCTKKISCGLIYTMNIPQEMMTEWGYADMFEEHMRFLSVLGGTCEYLAACDTYQFDDYSKYHAPMFDADHKRRRRDAVFPSDCEKAYQMGVRLAGGPPC